MTISLLRITDFRNLVCAELAPCTQGLNILFGNNGSGKTSILEAIHCLGLTRSFRTASLSRVVNHQAEKFSLFGRLGCTKSIQTCLGFERDLHGQSRYRFAERDIQNMAELAASIPLRLINSQSHQILEGSPSFRRKFLDWGLFYQSDQFLSIWRAYDRVLRQRNTTLREQRPRDELASWTTELVQYGLKLNEMRQEYLEKLAVELTWFAQALLALGPLTVDYRPGWEISTPFRTVLEQSQLQDYGAGFTHFGPHRADLNINIQGVTVKHFLSRGQQKLLVCAMILAQGNLLKKEGKNVIYLIDDLPAELDQQSRKRLLSLLSKQQTQVFITAIESKTIEDVLHQDVPIKLFHVEHGCVVEQT